MGLVASAKYAERHLNRRDAKSAKLRPKENLGIRCALAVNSIAE